MSDEGRDFKAMVDAQDFGGTFTLPWCPACRRMRFGDLCIDCGQPLALGEFVSLESARNFALDAHNEGYETGRAEAGEL